jgi:hypothetical protein
VNKIEPGRLSRSANSGGNLMKNYILGSLATVVLILALAMPASVPAAPAAKNPAPVPAAAPAAEPHPEIRDAIESLRNARMHLQHAAHDFGGHRAEALRATDEAIHQLQLCLKYDR